MIKDDSGNKTTPRKLARSLVGHELSNAVSSIETFLSTDSDLTDRERTLIQEQVSSVVEMLHKKLGVTASNGHTAAESDDLTV